MADEKSKPNLLAQLEAKKRALDALLEAARAAAAVGILADVSGDIVIDGAPTIGNGVSTGQVYTVSDVPNGAFHGKSIPEAAKAFLDMVKAKQTTREIAAALRKGGIESTSDNFEGMVYNLLNRTRMNTAEFTRTDGKWGLAEWLAPNVRSLHIAATQTKQGKKTKKKSKSARKTPANKKEEPRQAQPEPAKDGGVQERMIKFMHKDVSAEYSTDELATALVLKKAIAAMLLGKLLKTGQIAKTATGKYRLAT